MLTNRTVDAAGAVGGRTAPDALVAAGTVAVFARWGVDAPRTIARAAAISAFCAHVAYYSTILARVRNPQNKRNPKMPPDDLDYAAKR